MTDEIWRPIPGFPAYMISNKGKVASHLKKVGKHKWIIDKARCKILKPSYTRYANVSLRRDGQAYQCRIAQLVLLAFVGECPDGLEVCHNNGDPTDNRLDNLRYDTHRANIKDAIRHCNDWPKRRFSNKQIIEIRTRSASGENNKIIAADFRVDPSTISRIALGKSYKSVGGPIRKAFFGKHIRNIREERINGASLKQLADKYDMSVSGISRIVLGNRHKDIEGPLVEKPWSISIREENGLEALDG